MENINHHIAVNGFFIVENFYSHDCINEMIEQLERHHALQYTAQEVTDFNLLTAVPLVKNLAQSQEIISLVKPVLGESTVPVNAFVLDKTLDNNWGLDWHQDVKIAVKKKIETEGYENWTVESGIPHTIPPTAILEKRLAVRLHLDDCFIENGAMLIAPQSHRWGVVKHKPAIEKITTGHTLYCEVQKGGIMIFSPLLFHKSPYSTTHKKRRILQIDYVGTSLSNGLEWYQ
jgi:ectoine hydroxylase-related dioxygenase (phytanoyl-CoA dioxygenase family)